MQLTIQTDFAFRILIYLSRKPQGELAKIQQISDFYGISANHVAKVVVKLAKLGYVSAYRGKGGGITLAMPPTTINLAEIVKAFETTLKAVNCDRPVCAISANCLLKGILFEAMEQFLLTLGKYTLADLLSNETLMQVIVVK